MSRAPQGAYILLQHVMMHSGLYQLSCCSKSTVDQALHAGALGFLLPTAADVSLDLRHQLMLVRPQQEQVTEAHDS